MSGYSVGFLGSFWETFSEISKFTYSFAFRYARQHFQEKCRETFHLVYFPDFAAALCALDAKLPGLTLPPFPLAVALWMRADALEVMLDFAMILCFKNEPTRSLLGIRAKTFWENFGKPKFWIKQALRPF